MSDFRDTVPLTSQLLLETLHRVQAELTRARDRVVELTRANDRLVAEVRQLRTENRKLKRKATT